MKLVVITALQELYGEKKISTVYQTAQGDNHEFDCNFIKAFDMYLGNEVNEDMIKSQYNNIILFIDFADGKIDSTHSEYNRMVEFDKYLATYEGE